MKILVYYVDVGNLPKTKAENYLSEVKTKFRQDLNEIGLSTVPFFVIPSRTRPTEVAVLEL